MSRLVDRSHVANTEWKVWQSDEGRYSPDQVRLAVLLDIRDELRKLNALLRCPNFTGIPSTLRSIRRAMPAKRARRAT